jgi:hypothetical protein
VNPANHPNDAGVVPAAVRALDAFCNQRVVSASTDAEQNEWLAEKVRIKQRLAALPDSLVEQAALAELKRLRESA